MTNILKWLLAVAVYYSGLLTLYRRFAVRDATVILMYHRVCDDRHSAIAVLPDFFRRQLAYLQRAYHVVPFAAAVPVAGRRGALAVTFDDGFRDNYLTAFPLLRGAGVPATIFLTYDCVERGESLWTHRLYRYLVHGGEGTLRLPPLGELSICNDNRIEVYRRVSSHLKRVPNEEKASLLEEIARQRHGADPEEQEMLSWDEVREMAPRGIEFGAHTLSHPILSRVTEEDARREISGSRELIGERLGRPVTYFAYPNGQPGDISDRVVALTRQAGYAAAVTTVEGVNRPGADPFLLKRIDVNNAMCTHPLGGYSRALFAVKVAGFFEYIRGK